MYDAAVRVHLHELKSSAIRARRLLDGKTFEVLSLELAALESVDEFRAMRKNIQSDLRQAPRLLAEYQAEGLGKHKRLAKKRSR